MKTSFILLISIAVFLTFGCSKFDEALELPSDESGNVDASITNRTTNTYPYGNGSCTSAVDPWAFYKKQCTSYVTWKMNEVFDNSPYSSFPFYNTMSGSGSNGACNQNAGQLSNACRWAERLASIGYFVSSTPTPGSIAHWGGNEGGASSYGHVAYVESVNSNNTVTISEYNWSGACSFGNRYNISAPRYIRFNRLQLTSTPTINPNPIIQGQGVTVTLSLKNNLGEAYTSDIRCMLYNSNNIPVGEIQVLSNQYFSANQTKTFTFTKPNISSSPGAYKIWIESRAFSGSPWTLVHKPNASSTVNVNIVSAAKPDLVVLSPNAPSSANRGASISVSCTVKNSGTANAGSSILRYYLSTNNSYGSNDIPMDSDPVSSLAPGSTSPESESFVIPSNLPIGTWYILFRADADGQVTESNESNNVSYKSIVIN